MKIPINFKLPNIDWQKYLRPALGIMAVIAFAYAGWLIRSSQSISLDEAYLQKQVQQNGLQQLKINQQLLDSLASPPATVPPGRSPFTP